jgi:hypothetical protein
MAEIASKNQQQQEQHQESSALNSGTSAPDFTLHSKPGESVSLSQFRVVQRFLHFIQLISRQFAEIK